MTYPSSEPPRVGPGIQGPSDVSSGSGSAIDSAQAERASGSIWSVGRARPGSGRERSASERRSPAIQRKKETTNITPTAAAIQTYTERDGLRAGAGLQPTRPTRSGEARGVVA